MNLRYCMMTAEICHNETRHPQQVMRDLGITYQHAVPQSISDSWEFWNCKNVIDLPSYLTPFDMDPMCRIGRGLSQEDAEKIRDYKR